MKPVDLEILFNDPDYVAVNKPARLASIPGRAETDSVLEMVGRQLDLPASGIIDPRIRVVHRLDKETSGVMLFAKHSSAQRHVSHQFQTNTAAKEYLALVAGRFSERSGRIEADLAPQSGSSHRVSVVRHGGRAAVTEWKLESQFRDCALLRVFPKTGKTHQIRVHMKYIGHPLMIDPLYNPTRPGIEPGIFLSGFKRKYKVTIGEPERPLIDRLTLHAERLRVQHLNGSILELQAELHKDFRAVLNMLSKFAR